ncbi:phage tail fiber repeat family protein [Escherichia coli 2-156-04_S1_C3]|nr:phage tail protein [Escherichia coli]KDW09058.1 phage tail fiber repeat family protein [Escherichia coli 2-156-04_S1_C3]
MSTKFYTLLTDIGAAKLASAAALGVPLKITHMAVGDGGGVLPTPDAKQTALVNEKRRAALNMLYIDPQNSSQIIAEQVIPENEGGWWIREVGLFDESGALIAVGNCPESYKPQLAEGSGRTQTVRMVLITSSTDNITLKIDPAVVLATRKYVDDKALELKVYADDQMAKHLAAPDPHSQYAPKASPTFTGTPKAPTPAAGNNTTQVATTAFVQAALTDLINGAPATLDTLKEIAAAINNDPNFSTTINNALALKAPLSSPALTGTPTAPTAAQSVNNTQIATTAFVKSAIAGMVGSAPAALDTLNELAAALGNDPNFATTMLNALAGKQPLDNTLTNLSGKDVAGLLTYLGIKNASTTQVGLVRLTSSRVSGAEDIAATANAVAQNYTDIKSLQNKTQDSTTTQKGIVQLTSSRVSESETLAATAKAAAMNYADIVALQGKTNDATTTNKGIIRVSDSRTSTESGVAASSLAASQNYSDMKGLFGQCGMKSRNLGVVYTNSQSFAIFVSVNAVLSDGSSFLSANVSVDGNSANFRGSQTTNLAGQRATIAFMVPAGATYIVQQFSGTVSDVTWVEVDKK